MRPLDEVLLTLGSGAGVVVCGGGRLDTVLSRRITTLDSGEESGEAMLLLGVVGDITM